MDQSERAKETTERSSLMLYFSDSIGTLHQELFKAKKLATLSLIKPIFEQHLKMKFLNKKKQSFFVLKKNKIKIKFVQFFVNEVLT